MVFSGIVEEMGSVISLKMIEDLVMWDGSVGKGTILTIKAVVALVINISQS